MLKHGRRGSRVQNYWPRPVRYSISGGSVADDDGWGFQLLGALFAVIGGLLLLGPVLYYAGDYLWWIAFMLGPINILGAGEPQLGLVVVGMLSLAGGLWILRRRS